MKEDIKDLWVAALRSGKYKQGKNHLKNNNAFCCLGVLCDISGLGSWSENNNYLNRNHSLPIEIIKWAGMNSNSGNIKGKSSLANLNDSGYSFEQIADVIEENWKIL